MNPDTWRFHFLVCRLYQYPKLHRGCQAISGKEVRSQEYRLLSASHTAVKDKDIRPPSSIDRHNMVNQAKGSLKQTVLQIGRQYLHHSFPHLLYMFHPGQHLRILSLYRCSYVYSDNNSYEDRKQGVSHRCVPQKIRLQRLSELRLKQPIPIRCIPIPRSIPEPIS